MLQISSTPKSAIVIFITGLSLLNATQLQAHTVGYEVMAPVITKQKAMSSNTRSSIETEMQPSVPIPLMPNFLPTDNIVSQAGWQDPRFSEAYNKKWDSCLFGDSISKQVGDTLGGNTFNFALGGMTTDSLIEQLQVLAKENVRCKTAIIAMGTNDAQVNRSDDIVVKNLKDSISLLRSMGAKKVFLIPAFYSTLEASHDPRMAGTIAKVEEVNAFIRQVAATEDVNLFEKDIQILYEGQALRKDLTIDGVHLNDEGRNMYRRALLKITR